MHKKAFTLAEVFSTHFANQRKCAFTLAEVFSTHFANQRKCAFTLAEVLITLGIIGIVAAMTLPTLVGKYQKKQTVVRLKKAYTVLQQAVKISELSNGAVDDWNYAQGSKEFYEQYLKPYLSLIKEQQNSTLPIASEYKFLNGSVWTGTLGSTNSYCGTLSDGMYLFVSSSADSNYKTIGVDINGRQKPNTVGKDVFYLVIQPKYGVTPYGYGVSGSVHNERFGYNFDREVLLGNSNNASCNANKYGDWCTALIMTDNWEIKDDYPW